MKKQKVKRKDKTQGTIYQKAIPRSQERSIRAQKQCIKSQATNILEQTIKVISKNLKGRNSELQTGVYICRN